jgi:G:T/U-mismatch repair DNA glycosylase
MGLIFMNDRDALWDCEVRRFDLDAIKSLLDREGIALWDTAMAVRRLKDNASDKFLEIVEPINLAALLDAHPSINQIVATGEKAASVVAAQASINVPSILEPVDCSIANHPIRFWRMPSTSRAYPLALDKKADAYRVVFES